MKVLLFLALAVAFGALPLVVYTLILWWFDRYEREPWPLLVGAFLWGAVPAAILSVVIGLVLNLPLVWLLSSDGLAYPLASSGVAAPLVEEAMKGLGLAFLVLLFRDEMDSLFDGLLYGAVIGFGFGAVENVLYLVVSEDLTSLVTLAGIRAVLFGFNHAMYTSFLGLGFAASRLTRSPFLKWGMPLLGYAAAALAHASHNTGLTLVEISPLGLGFTLAADAFGLGFVLVLLIVARWREGVIVREYLRDEVQRGTLTPEEHTLVSSVFGRELARWGLLIKGDLSAWRRLGRFQNACAELAFGKRRLARDGDPSDVKVQRLRNRVVEVNPTS